MSSREIPHRLVDSRGNTVVSTRTKEEASCQGDKGIRTDRPWQENDMSRTECDLNDDLNQAVDSPATSAQNENLNVAQRIISIFSSGTTQYSTAGPIGGYQFRLSDDNDESAWTLAFQKLYGVLWKRRGCVAKTIIAIWLLISTLQICKIATEFVNVYFFVNFDDCDAARTDCLKYGMTCFSSCNVTKWDMFTRRIFGFNNK